VRTKSLIIAALIVVFALGPISYSFAADKNFSETKGLEKAYWFTGSVLMTPVWASLKTLYSVGGLGAGFVTMVGTLGSSAQNIKEDSQEFDNRRLVCFSRLSYGQQEIPRYLRQKLISLKSIKKNPFENSEGVFLFPVNSAIVQSPEQF